MKRIPAETSRKTESRSRMLGVKRKESEWNVVKKVGDSSIKAGKQQK